MLNKASLLGRSILHRTMNKSLVSPFPLFKTITTNGSSSIQALEFKIGSSALSERGYSDTHQDLMDPVEKVYQKYDSIYEVFKPRIIKKFPSHYEQELEKFAQFLKDAKDVGDYEQKFVDILKKMYKYKEKGSNDLIEEEFHKNFIPIFTNNREEIVGKVKFEMDNRPAHMDLLPRVYYVIINEYLTSLLKRKKMKKAVSTLKHLQASSIVPTSMHIVTVLSYLSENLTFTETLGQVLQKHKKAFLSERPSTYARRYGTAYLYLLHGFNLLGCYDEAVEYINANNIVDFADQTNNGALIAKICRIVLQQKNLGLFDQLKTRFLTDMSRYATDYVKDKLMFVLIDYYCLIGDIANLSKVIEGYNNRDNKFYLLLLKQLYKQDKNSDLLQKLITQIPSDILNEYHIAYLIRKLADEHDYTKARKVFYSSLPKEQVGLMMTVQILRAIHLENNKEKGLLEALAIYENYILPICSTLTGEQYSLYILKIMKDSGNYEQAETFFRAIEEPRVPHYRVMASIYMETKKDEKLLECKNAIEKFRYAKQ